MEIITRRQAADAGAKRFYTGSPCRKGHDAPRFVSTGACVKCSADHSKSYSQGLRMHFTYPAHPDDCAALLAYAQALDLQRGRTPHAMNLPAPIDTAALREIIFGKALPPPAPYLPKP